MTLIECIPNFSEGRRPEVVDEITRAVAGVADVSLLDVQSDATHNRSVVTFVGHEGPIAEAAYRAIRTAAELIDLNEHEGAHPRFGATDVCPFVPLRAEEMATCVETAGRLAQRVARELAIPVFLYEDAARVPEHRNLAVIRGKGFEEMREDGDHVEEGMAVAQVAGSAVSILKAERLALNFLQHLSGVATETWEMVRLVCRTHARIVDTRKTIPGLRLLEKYAVRMGCGANHRFGLSDGVLIKDNHIEAVGSIKNAVARAREAVPHLTKIEVECASLEQVREALDAGADAILLDNMEPGAMARAVEIVDGRALTGASGNITRRTIVAVAETGVDLISSGAITHSARALDISLKFEDPDPPAERRLQRIR